jgi:hypothetical protein
VHIDRERNAAEADECDAEFFFAQEQPPEFGSAVPPLLECSFAWIGLEIQVIRNASARSDLANRSNALANRPRIMRRATVDGPASVAFDGGHGKRHNSNGQVATLPIQLVGPLRKV